MKRPLGRVAQSAHAVETIVSAVVGVPRTLQRAYFRASVEKLRHEDPVDARHAAVNAAIDVVSEDLDDTIQAARDIFASARDLREWARARRKTRDVSG